MSNGTPTVDAMCGGGKTKVPRNSPVPEIAELYAYALFRHSFRSRLPAGETFTNWDLFRQTTGRSVIDLALKQISTDFRNYYARSQRARRLIMAGTPASGLREGRQLRADGLGIAIDPIQRAIVCELLEITTVDEAEDALLEDIAPKLALLRGPIKTLLENQLREARLNQSFVPERFLASGTPWIIPPELSVVPLFPSSGQDPSSVTYRWICFAPTYAFRPMPIGPFATAEPETSPTRGLIVYSYHEAKSRQQVPDAIFRRFRDWAAQQERARLTLQLLPMPVATQYWQDNNDDLKALLGYLALGTAAVALVVLAVYLAPIVAGSAAAVLSSLSAAASVESLIAGSAAIVAAISAALPQIMRTAQTVLNAATSLGPRFAIVP